MSVSTQDFEHSIVVRPMAIEDFDQVLELQRLCFPGGDPWTRAHVESQISRFPRGQMVVELDGRVVASSSSLVVEVDEYAEGHTWDEIADRGFIRNHDPDGDTLYGIEIMVHPDLRGRKLARRLYHARHELCRELNLKRIVIGGRIPGYRDHRDEMTAREYVERVLEHTLFDPVLTVQIKSGFTLKRLIRSYLEEDVDSDGWATLLEWVNLDYRRPTARQLRSARPVRVCVVQYRMRYIESFEEFAQQCTYFVDVASGYRSDFVLFPELLTTQLLSLWPQEQPAAAVRKLAGLTPQYLDMFSRLAIAHDINIVGGSHFTLQGERLHNVAYLFKRNGEIGQQHKLHITPNERIWWGVQPGSRVEVFDTDKGKVSIQICYDVEFPEVSRLAVERGARIVFVPFCTDERQGYLRVRYCAQARCIENQIYAAIAGTVGNLPAVKNMDIQYAQSAIFTPSDFPFSRDAVGAECTPNIETVAIYDIDLELLERYRQKGTVRNWLDRRTDLYELRYHEPLTEPEDAQRRPVLERPIGG